VLLPSTTRQDQLRQRELAHEHAQSGLRAVDAIPWVRSLIAHIQGDNFCLARVPSWYFNPRLADWTLGVVSVQIQPFVQTLPAARHEKVCKFRHRYDLATQACTHQVLANGHAWSCNTIAMARSVSARAKDMCGFTLITVPTSKGARIQ